MDVYVFVRRASKEHIGALQEIKGVRHVASLISGEFDALVFGETEDEEGYRTFLADVRAAARGAMDKAVAIAVPPPDGDTSLAPRRFLVPAKYVVHVRVRVQAGRSEDVLEAALGQNAVAAASIVAGSFDLLVNVTGETLDDVRDGLLALNSIPGIAWTDSAVEVVSPGETLA